MSFAVAGVLRWCSPCGQEQPFEVPPCIDGHGDGCPDLACLECGHAVVLAVALEEPAELAIRAA